MPHRHVTSWRHGSTNDGFFLETEVRFNDGQDRMWRSLHLFRVADGRVADGRVAEHTLYCSGIWSAAAHIARYEAQAPLAHRLIPHRYERHSPWIEVSTRRPASRPLAKNRPSPWNR